MNAKLRIAVLVLLAALAAWLGVPGCTRAPDEAAAPPPARKLFDGSQPLQVDVVAARNATGGTFDAAWLEPELRRVLRLGGLQLAPLGAERGAYLLRVAISVDGHEALLALIAPDQVLERERSIAIENAARLSVARTLAAELPEFLRGANVAADLSALLDARDARAYDALTRAADELLGAAGRGFTRPASPPSRTRTVERLEALVRSHPRWGRARALLALGYLSLGGEDEASLTQLAAASAERAVALDADIADAHAALGLAAWRRGHWTAARERFATALRLDADNAPAAEGLACLLADAGLYEAALPIAARAVALQPHAVGARECLAYVAGEPPRTAQPLPAAQAQTIALRLILSGEAAAAERVLRASLRPAQFGAWAQPLLRALATPRRTPDALRAITRAGSDGQIDAVTEILCGAALQQADFALNRMARLQREQVRAPLRILWLREAAFLRRHPHFQDVVSAAGLPAFWQQYGAPDVCASETQTYVCQLAKEPQGA